jgi:hypothetical protein
MWRVGPVLSPAPSATQHSTQLQYKPVYCARPSTQQHVQKHRSRNMLDLKPSSVQHVCKQTVLPQHAQHISCTNLCLLHGCNHWT